MKFGGSIYLHVGIEHSQTAQSKIDNEEEKQAKNNEGKNQEKKTWDK